MWIPAPSAKWKPAADLGLSRPALGIPPGPFAPRSGRGALPVPHSAGEVQTGLLQVGLEVGQEEIPSALGADVGRPVFVHPLMGVKAAAIGHDHGTRCTNLGGEEHREVQPGTYHVYKRALKPFPQMDNNLQYPKQPQSMCRWGKRSAGTLQGTF